MIRDPDDDDVSVQAARRLLRVWGRWQQAVQANGHRLDYPHSSAFVHAEDIFEGGQGFIDDQITPEIELMDGILVRVDRVVPRIYQALLCEYLWNLGNYDAAKRCRCSETTYRDRRRTGEHMVAGMLTIATKKSA